VDYLAEQLDIADPSCVKDYRVREMTRLEHATQIRDAYGFVEFTAAAEELTRWVDDRAWTTGEGPTALFDGAVVWLREHRVLLPGVSTLARLVAQIRDAALTRLRDTLAGALTAAQVTALELLLEVPAGARTSDLERLRRGGAVRRADDHRAAGPRPARPATSRRGGIHGSARTPGTWPPRSGSCSRPRHEMRLGRTSGLLVRCTSPEPSEHHDWEGGQLATHLRMGLDLLFGRSLPEAVADLDAVLRAGHLDRAELAAALRKRSDSGVVLARTQPRPCPVEPGPGGGLGRPLRHRAAPPYTQKNGQRGPSRLARD
jgi:hypothetical protein